MAIDGGEEDERVEADQQEENCFYAERRVEIVFRGLCPEEQKATREHEGEAGTREWKDCAGNTRDANLAEDEAEHAEIEDRNGSYLLALHSNGSKKEELLRTAATLETAISSLRTVTAWLKMRPSMLIATALVAAIRTAVWTAKGSGDPLCSNVDSDLDREVSYAASVAVPVMHELVKKHEGLFPGKREPICAQTKSESLRSNFETPPAEARPRLWWHWLNGNVTKEGNQRAVWEDHDLWVATNSLAWL